ncbi:PEP/pyruvate-binding domain-containing protein [Bythopirellula polymerisocia]|uniref:Phosphoenolpyruvate synthase n=1 Tax=Bythopirellula polymerisocia TaxID=2528003 RepID=A0A5C6D264_9BACT|nr:PEP/pyruvate-binding domain-containing protein [Bythopirellula polymerisocia]TWU29871.1 Phosphoenolpyruvate synthase [Bythopirellula polymerisocia]
MNTPYTLQLDQIDRSKVAICGGKGSSLGELVRVGVRVPTGFVVTRSAFDSFMTAADPDRRVPRWLAEVDSGGTSVAVAAEAIAELLGEAEIPEEILAAIESGAKNLNIESVSVRSSATCEDGTSNAWAGQLDTFLDVAPEDIASQVQACWMSIFRAPALAYGAAHGYGAGEFGVAVVVQEMISSEVSGIGFSVHPVTQEPDVRLIEACFGLGEAIVSGKIVPDQYVVKRGAQEIMESSQGGQRQGLFLNHGEPEPQWRELGSRGSEPKLTDAQVLEYARLLDRIEDHYGFPVDTEWALTGDEFHLLQARPITTLAQEYREEIVDHAEPWMSIVRRPLPLLEASIIGYWLDSRHAGHDFGFHCDRFLAIQDSADLTTMFPPKKSFEAALEHIRHLDRTDRGKLVAFLERGRKIYQRGFEQIEQGETFRDLDDAIEHFIEVGRYTTSLPSATLIALEQGHIDDPQVREIAEELRSHSLYPRYLSKLIEPIVQELMLRLGFSEPDRAPELVTWRELHQKSINRETLEDRLEKVRAGQRFVHQILGDEERLNFVTETGYLLMREMGHRQIFPPDDPNQISGQTAWPGIHRGRARVVLTSEPEGIELNDGEVLVSIQSNPNLMPLLRHAGAIVTDDGGVACHAGIICRELKIPTIIGTGRATSTICEGDLVEVDAINQVVRIIERAENK